MRHMTDRDTERPGFETRHAPVHQLIASRGSRLRHINHQSVPPSLERSPSPVYQSTACREVSQLRVGASSDRVSRAQQRGSRASTSVACQAGLSATLCTMEPIRTCQCPFLRTDEQSTTGHSTFLINWFRRCVIRLLHMDLCKCKV